MGDRGNIAMRFEDGGTVYLYAHWGGWRMPETLRRALAGRDRWDDESYLMAIITRRSLVLQSADTETGECDPTDLLAECGMGTTSMGISPYLTDNEYPILFVVPSRQAVYLVSEDDVRSEKGLADVALQTWTFEEYAAQPGASWDHRNRVQSISPFKVAS